MGHRYKDAERQQFAERARTEPVSTVARDAGVLMQTVYGWMKKYGVRRSSDAPDTHGSLAGASLEGPADGDVAKDDDLGYKGVKGALPPDNSKISYWIAENWELRQTGEPLVEIVAFPDGRHGLVMPDYDASDPRGDVHDLFVGIGTFAGVGRSLRDCAAAASFADDPHPEDEQAGRVTWWRSARHVEEGCQLRWMVAEMMGAGLRGVAWEQVLRATEHRRVVGGGARLPSLVRQLRLPCVPCLRRWG